MAAAESANIMGKAVEVNGTKVLVAALEGADSKTYVQWLTTSRTKWAQVLCF